MDNSPSSSILKTATQSSAGMICIIFSFILFCGHRWITEMVAHGISSPQQHTAVAAGVKYAHSQGESYKPGSFKTFRVGSIWRATPVPKTSGHDELMLGFARNLQVGRRLSHNLAHYVRVWHISSKFLSSARARPRPPAE
jgi:hypothetical protein